METISKTKVRIDELPDVLRRLSQKPVPPEVLRRRRQLLAEARKIRDEMELLDEDVKDIIRRQRGDGPIG